jgi:hypothetical protein
MRELELWTVYDHPSDFPQCYVARRFVVTGGTEARATEDVMVSVDVETIRDELRSRGFISLRRDDRDDPKIIETWVG